MSENTDLAFRLSEKGESMAMAVKIPAIPYEGNQFILINTIGSSILIDVTNCIKICGQCYLLLEFSNKFHSSLNTPPLEGQEKTDEFVNKNLAEITKYFLELFDKKISVKLEKWVSTQMYLLVIAIEDENTSNS